MYEKVNPKHPDKIADRIAGMIVDIAYTKKLNPKVGGFEEFAKWGLIRPTN